MSAHLNWAILGTGAIAKRFAEGLPLCKSGALVAVGSRSQETADNFCAEFGGKAYASYEAAIADPDVQAVYIALPHHLHKEWTIRAAQAGKHILCEKPFTLNLAEAREALQAVQAAGVFFMEAFMYRFHPQTLTVREMLKNGVIGDVRMIQTNMGGISRREGKHFRIDAPLGGGAMMDVGCYPVSFARMVAGEEPHKLMYSAKLVDGYDAHGVGLMEFPSGIQCTFACAIDTAMNNQAVIIGERGQLILTDPWFCNGPAYVHLNGRDPEPIRIQPVPHLWGNQSVVVAQLAERHQAPFMSWDDSLGNMRTLDMLRKAAGVTAF
jgi:predicted dehydrogenase